MSQYSLSNEQLLYIYHHMMQVRKTYEKIINSGTVHQSMVNTHVVAVMHLPKDMLEEIKSSEHFRQSISITDKLRPIAEMITEAEPELAKAVFTAFQKDDYNDSAENL